MNIIKHRKIFYVISGVLMLASIFSIFYFGLNLGIDFKGGTIIEVEYASGRPDQAGLVSTIKDLVGVNEVTARPTGDKGYIIRTSELTDKQRQDLTGMIGGKDSTIKRFDTVGPILGEELRGKALWSIVLVILAIVLFITFTFRKVSRPVASWKYGVVAIVALVHDVLVPTGAFVLLGHYFGFEIDALFVTAILVILGFSVHDTIVVFDRTRENLKHNPEGKHKKTFEEIVGASISQTFTRSINTSLTVVLSLIVLYFFGPETTKNFSLVLLIGIIAGTYSSIFLGSPLLVTLEKWQEKKNN